MKLSVPTRINNEIGGAEKACTKMVALKRHDLQLTWFDLVTYCTSQKNISQMVTRSFLEWEVRGSNLWQVKSNTVLPTAHHPCNISSKGSVWPGCNDADMGPANSLHALAYYSKYNERFDLI